MLAAVPQQLPAAAIVSETLANTLPSTDDASASPVNIGFTISFLGVSYSQLSVNENGNVTFADSGYSDYTAGNLNETGRPILAPFLADVSTTGQGSGKVT